jgi:putative transposase
LLNEEWDRSRYVWNQCVARRDAAWKAGEPAIYGSSMTTWLTSARADKEWLRDGSQVVQQQTIRTWDQSLRHSFKVKGRGRPRFKSFKRDLPSLEYTRNGFTIKDRRLNLAKGISIPVVWSRDLPSVPSSCRVFCDSLGHWYVSFVVRRIEIDAPYVDPSDEGIGIDWGVKATATTTDPAFDLPHSHHGRALSTKLKKSQQKMSRRRPKRGATPSRGYLEAKTQTAKLYAKAARQRKDEATKWAKRIVDNFDLIAVEDFKPKFMSKNRGLAKVAADAAIGQAKQELINRGKRAGRNVVLVPPAYSSQTCSGCGARAKQHLELRDRVYRCDDPICGLIVDRDVNAARNIRAWAGQPQ